MPTSATGSGSSASTETTRPSIYRWLPGRGGARSPIAAAESGSVGFRTAVLVTGFRLFYWLNSRGANRDTARA